MTAQARHPQIEKLERLFEEGKTNTASFNRFFEELWLAGAMWNREELRSIVNRMKEWAKSQVPPDPNKLALAKLGSGFVSFHEGNFHESIKELTEAEKLFKESNDEDGVFACVMMEGGNYRTLGELELALKYMLDAYHHLLNAKRHKVFLDFAIYQLGEIYSETGHNEEALRFHQMTEDTTKERGNMNMLARTYNGIGVVYQHQKKYSLAEEYLTKSLGLAEELNNLPVKARALTDLGSFYYEMGDYKKAEATQREALEIRDELKIGHAAVTNMIHLGDIAIKTGNLEEAIQWLNKGLKSAEELKVKPKMFQVHQKLSEIYLSKGDLMKSLFHYKAFHQIREEVQHEDNEKKIKNLHMIFEAEQTKKENVIIKAQKAEIETKNQQLRETIDELTITRISRKAKVLTFIIGIILIVAQDPIFEIVLKNIPDTYFFSILAKVVIILSLKPLDIAIENYLLRRIVLKKRKAKTLAVK